jgi:protein TorT
MPVSRKNAPRLVAAAAALLLLVVTGCGAVGQKSETNGSPDSADVNWSVPALDTKADGSTERITYTPIDPAKITRHSKICVLFPHMKDSYWAATNYGTLVEAQRDKVSYQMFEAGGYTNLSTQVSQMQDCITQGYNAIILGAISSTGLCSQIASALAKGIPVVDFVNGVNCPDSNGNPKFSHALVSFHDLAVTTAQYLNKHSGGKRSTVGFFPGPEGASWSDAAVNGFTTTIQGTPTQIAVTRRGDTGKDVQLGLIEDALKAYPDITDLVGVDIAAEAAVIAVRNANKAAHINVYAFDLIPPVFDSIVNGEAVGSPTDFTVIQGRMAIDQAVWMLEGQTLPAPTSGPIPQMVTADNAKSIPWTNMFAPKDFHATYSWNH